MGVTENKYFRNNNKNNTNKKIDIESDTYNQNDVSIFMKRINENFSWNLQTKFT